MGKMKREIKESVLKRFLAQAVIDLLNVQNFEARFMRLLDDRVFSPENREEVLSHTDYRVTLKDYSSIVKNTVYKHLLIGYAKQVRVGLPNYIRVNSSNMKCVVEDKRVRIQPMLNPDIVKNLSRPKHDDSLMDAMFDVPTNMPTMESLASAGLSPTGRKRSAIEKQRGYMLAHGASPRQYGKTLAQTMKVDVVEADRLMAEYAQCYKNLHKDTFTKHKIDMADIEARMLGHTSIQSTNHCGEIFLDTTPKTCSLFSGLPKIKEKPMENLKVTRPVMVGNVDILTAQPFQLDSIIREAQRQIDAGADLQKLSQHHRNMKTELEEVIKLCVAQLDKGLETKESLVS